MQGAAEIRLVFESQEEGGFHVSSPDVPGLNTEGETRAGAIENLTKPLLLALALDENDELR